MESMREERREATRWWLWALGLVVLSLIVFAILGYAGVFTHTAVERKVFEASYQRSEGLKQEVSIFEAQIAELEGQLVNPNLDESAKANIHAQLSAIRVRLAAAMSQQ